jgi:hypothetical protein
MKLLDQVRRVLRLKHYSYRTENGCVRWAEPFTRFRKGPGGFRRPPDLGTHGSPASLTLRPPSSPEKPWRIGALHRNGRVS